MTSAELFSRIAIPRATGTEGNHAVREILTGALQARGFKVETQEFPAGPDSLVAVQLAGALLGGGAFATLLLSQVRGFNLLPLFALVLIGGIVIQLQRASNRPPKKRATGVNLFARKGSGLPAAWLVAHYDSKSQPLSMAGRIVTVTMSVVGAAGILVFSSAPSPMAAVLLLPAMLGGAMLARCRTENRSPGALDNGSAVVAIFEILDRAPDARVGVFFPDAEEWGLLGARAAAQGRPDLFGGRPVINLDGLDDQGSAILFVHRPGPLGDRLQKALRARVARRLPVFVDGIALAPVAGECVTIMKGNWGTARIVHTPRDVPGALTLTGAKDVAQGVAAVLGGR
ncbi:MAG TPA: M28 family peptidase [Gemmatimonadales bacterium]|nr:M28 family peptidase [Gemmatimonadales bacterium]